MANRGMEARLFCKRHKAVYDKLQLNLTAVMAAMMDIFLRDTLVDAANPEEAAEKLSQRMLTVETICCTLTDAQHDEIIGQTPQTTGDEDLDELEAMEIVPGFSRNNYEH